MTSRISYACSLVFVLSLIIGISMSLEVFSELRTYAIYRYTFSLVSLLIFGTFIPGPGSMILSSGYRVFINDGYYRHHLLNNPIKYLVWKEIRQGNESEYSKDGK